MNTLAAWPLASLVLVIGAVLANGVAHAEAADDSRLRQLAGQSVTYTGEVRELLAKGADPNAPGQGGRTALHAAAGIGATETLRTPLEAGGNPNRRDQDGNTPLHIASDASQATLTLDQRTAHLRYPPFSIPRDRSPS